MDIDDLIDSDRKYLIKIQKIFLNHRNTTVRGLSLNLSKQ